MRILRSINRKSILALLLSGLVLMISATMVSTVRAQDWWSWVTNLSNDLNFGNTNTGGGTGGADADKGAAMAAKLASIIAEIKAYFGDANSETAKQLINNVIVSSLNSDLGQKYISNNPIYKAKLESLGLIDSKSGNTKVTLDKAATAVNNAVISTDTLNPVGTTGTVGAGSTLTKQSNGLLAENVYAYKFTDANSLVSYLKGQAGYTVNGSGNLVAPNGVTDTVATAYYNLLKNGGNGSSPFTNDPACTQLVNGKIQADWNDEGSGSGTGTDSGTGTGHTAGTSSGTGTTVTACTFYTYGDWGTCTSGSQSRTITAQTPSGCTDTSSATLKQTCVAVKPEVTNTTNAAQSVADVVLSVSTLRTVTCRYGTSSSFSYGGGTTFGTTGNYIHNTALSGLTNGSHTYYVICQDGLTGGMSDTVTVTFTVTLSTGAAPVVNNITPPTQTNASSTLSVTTEPGAVCRYQKDNATFAFESGTTMSAADNNHSHSASIASLGNGTYTFYVVCRDISTGVASTAKQIVTTINYLPNDTNAPVLTNTTLGYQTTSSPVISVTTNYDSTCQYSTSTFSFGAGTYFTTDGAADHSVKLSVITNGQHGYYVICKRISNNAVSAQGYQVIFTVSAGGDAGTCITLSSNDRQNNSDRSASSDTGSDTVYPWQSAETGTREKFTNVDWYAGYQFTPEKDGKVTQLCGYFDSGVVNKVSLFNGSYSELASAQITGTGKWKCANISPVSVVADGRYYVITRANNTPIYFEYKSGLLPVDAGNVVIEAGIRQTFIQGKFKTDIVKYDYMIFGLVDVKINFGDTSTSGPEITSVGPSGTVYTLSASLTAQTTDDAACSFDRDDVAYSKMKYSLPKISTGSFGQKVCGLEAGDYTFYIRCKNSSDGANDASKAAQFTVEQ